MSNLTFVEKRKFEQFLGMETGYVLDFSNRAFAEFVRDSTGQDIYNSRYDCGSGSKANRLRAFWQKEENHLVGKLMSDMLDYSGATGSQYEVCRLIVARLLQNTPRPDSESSNSHQSEPSKQQRRSHLFWTKPRKDIPGIRIYVPLGIMIIGSLITSGWWIALVAAIALGILFAFLMRRSRPEGEI